MQKIPYKTDQKNPAIKAYIEAVEKGKKDQHILPKEDGWIVTNLLSSQVSHIFNTQQEAIRFAEMHASHGTAVFIHGQNGLIIERKDF